MTKKKNWKLITAKEMVLHEYPCGLRAGMQVRLLRDITVQDHRGRETGTVHRAGEIWQVLAGNINEPNVIWLRQPNGKNHTWDNSVLEWFKYVEESDSHDHV